MKNLYDKINDENFNFDNYNKKDFTNLEKKKYKKNFKKNTSGRKKKFISIAAVILLVFGLFNTELGPIAYAKAEDVLSDFTYSIKNALDLNDNIEKYTSVINKEVTNHNISIKLNEVAIPNKNHIYLSAGIKVPEGYNLLNFDKKIYIDGKRYYDLSTSGSMGFDKDTNIDNIYYEIGLNKNIDLNKNLNIRIKISNLTLGNEKTNETKDINGSWDFNFMASGKELMLDTKVYNLNDKFSYQDEVIEFDNLSINKIDQSLHANIIKNSGNSKLYEVAGTDDLGNKVIFDLRKADKNNLYFKTQLNRINENAKELNLKVKSMNIREESGRLDHSQLKEIGNLTIKLK